MLILFYIIRYVTINEVDISKWFKIIKNNNGQIYMVPKFHYLCHFIIMNYSWTVYTRVTYSDATALLLDIHSEIHWLFTLYHLQKVIPYFLTTYCCLHYISTICGIIKQQISKWAHYPCTFQYGATLQTTEPVLLCDQRQQCPPQWVISLNWPIKSIYLWCFKTTQWLFTCYGAIYQAFIINSCFVVLKTTVVFMGSASTK